MFAIMKREIRAYFYSPIAYVLLGIFAFFSSLVFALNNIGGKLADLNGTFSNLAIILLFIIPLLTMKALSEDRKTGVDRLLISSPTTVAQMVVGKFAASYLVFLTMIVYTLSFPIILSNYGSPQVSMLLGTYLGYILLGGAFISIGILASALTESQIIAAVISFIISVLMMLMESISANTGGVIAIVLNWISLLSRYNSFNNGILQLSTVIYYISFMTAMLLITVQIVEKRRWTQG